MRDTLLQIDPRFAPQHATYYLRGILDHTAAERLPFTTRGFPRDYTDAQPLAFVLQRGSHRARIYISAGDKAGLDHGALRWADVYGKVNLDLETVPATDAHKIVPIGPGHGLRIWDLTATVEAAVRTRRSGSRLFGLRAHVREFWATYRRREEEAAYRPGCSEERYVYYNSWLWAKHGDVNPPRAEYVAACQDLAADGFIDFEGGFTARRRADMPEYDAFTARRRYSLPDYLERIKRSAVVFNNPAVHQCHGWKLAEFLRLGKAIISLPLSRAMPAPLVDGHHYHVVAPDRDAMKAAIRRIIEDGDYRRRLEVAARAYWLAHLQPQTVIERLADHAFGIATPRVEPVVAGTEAGPEGTRGRRSGDPPHL